MPQSEYRRGFDDGQASARAAAKALKGPDRTLYECIGGPKHGERVETGGGMYFRVVTLGMMYDPAFRGGPTIGYGEYKREFIGRAGGLERTVYVWQGERS